MTEVGKRAANIILETEKELKALIKKEKKKTALIRLNAALVIVQYPALTRNQISVMLGINKRSMERWLSNYKLGGLQAYLALKPKSPKKSVITKNVHEAISDRLLNEKTPFRGYSDAQKWILQEFNVFINYQTLRAYMIRHFGKRLKVSRSVLFIKTKHFKDTQTV